MTNENIFSKSKHAEIFEEETETLRLASLRVALSLSFLCKVYEKLERHLYLQLQELKIHLVRCDILRYGTNPLISFFFFPFSFSVIFFSFRLFFRLLYLLLYLVFHRVSSPYFSTPILRQADRYKIFGNNSKKPVVWKVMKFSILFLLVRMRYIQTNVKYHSWKLKFSIDLI